MASLDSVAISTSIPFDLVCSVINDICPIPSHASDFDVEEIIEQVKFCLPSNCFIFNDSFYRQLSGTIMGSSLSIWIAKLLMKNIENDTVADLDTRFLFWRRYIDTFLLQKKQI